MAVADYEPIIQAAAQEWNVDPALIKAHMQHESGGNAMGKDGKPIRGASGEHGLMQIMPATARDLGITDPDEVVQNIFGGTKYISQNLDRFPGNVMAAVAAYNAGPDRVANGTIPNSTRNVYVPSVAANYQKFAKASPPPAPAPEKKTEDMDAFLARTGASVGGAPNNDDDMNAFLARTGAKVVAAPPPVTPNDISGEGRDEYGNPIGPLGAAPQLERTPSAWEVSDRLKQVPGEVGAAVGPAIRSAVSAVGGALTTVPQTSTAIPNVVDAIAHGFGPVNAANPLGMGNKLIGALRDSGVYGPAPGKGNLLQSLNEGVLTPVGVAGDVAQRIGSGLFRGAQEAVQQTGKAFGNEALGRDLAAMPEAFMGSPGQFAGPPNSAPVNRLAVPEIASVRYPPPAIEGGTALDRIKQLINHDEAVTGGMPAEAAPANRLALADMPPPAPDIGSRSVGAAASREQSPPAAIDLNPKETAAYRATAETQKLLEPQPVGRDPTIYIEGVNPTQAHMEQSANVSREAKMLESAIPEEAKTVAKEHNEARQRHFSQLAGSPVDVANAEAARSTQADIDLAATWKNKQDTNAQPVLNAMAQVVASPDGRRPLVRNAMKSVADELAPDGKLLTDPEQLYGVRKHIDDLLSKEAGRDDAKSVRAAANLIEVKKVLDGVIETAAPGFRQYLDNFAAASKPIDTMRVLQRYEPKLIDTQGRMQLSRVQRMMNDIVTSRKADGINEFKSIPDEMMGPTGPLWALRDDLRRVASADELARAKGSDTVQNALDVAKNVGKAGITALAHTGANMALPVGGSFVLNAVTNKLAGNKLQKRAANMLRPDPSQYRPLNQPE